MKSDSSQTALQEAPTMVVRPRDLTVVLRQQRGAQADPGWKPRPQEARPILQLPGSTEADLERTSHVTERTHEPKTQQTSAAERLSEQQARPCV